MDCVPWATGESYDVNGLPETNPVNPRAALVQVAGDGNCFYYTIIEAYGAYSDAYPETWECMRDRLQGFADTYGLPLPDVGGIREQASTRWRELIAAHLRANPRMFTEDGATDSANEMRANYEYWVGLGDHPEARRRVTERASELLLDPSLSTGRLAARQAPLVAYAIANIEENRAYACGVEKDVVADLLNVMLFTYTHPHDSSWEDALLTQINGPRVGAREDAVTGYRAGGFVPRFNLIFTDIGAFGHYQCQAVGTVPAYDRAYLPHYNPKRFDVQAMGGANNPASEGDARTRELALDPGFDTRGVPVDGELYQAGAIEELEHQRAAQQQADALQASAERDDRSRMEKAQREKLRSDIVDRFKAHATQQIETAKRIMEGGNGRHMIVESDRGFISTIGRTGPEKARFLEWFGSVGANDPPPHAPLGRDDGELIREGFVDWLDEQFALLAQRYPGQVTYGKLAPPDSHAPKDLAQRDVAVFVWAANAANWKGEDGQDDRPWERQADATSGRRPLKVGIISTPTEGLPPDPAAPPARQGGRQGDRRRITGSTTSDDNDEAARYNYTDGALLEPQIDFVCQKLEEAHVAFVKHSSNRLNYGRIALMNVADPNAASVDPEGEGGSARWRTKAMHSQLLAEFEALRTWGGDPYSERIVKRWTDEDRPPETSTYDASAFGQAQAVVAKLVMEVFKSWTRAVSWWMSFKGNMVHVHKNEQAPHSDFAKIREILAKQLVGWLSRTTSPQRYRIEAAIVWDFMESAKGTLDRASGNDWPRGNEKYVNAEHSEEMVRLLKNGDVDAADGWARAPVHLEVSPERQALLETIDDAAALIANINALPDAAGALKDARWVAMGAAGQKENAEKDVGAESVLKRAWLQSLKSWFQHALDNSQARIILAEPRARALLREMRAIGYDNAAVPEYGALVKAVEDQLGRAEAAQNRSTAFWTLLRAYDRAFSAVYGEGSAVDAFKETFEAAAAPAPAVAAYPPAKRAAQAGPPTDPLRHADSRTPNKRRAGAQGAVR